MEPDLFDLLIVIGALLVVGVLASVSYRLGGAGAGLVLVGFGIAGARAKAHEDAIARAIKNDQEKHGQ